MCRWPTFRPANANQYGRIVNIVNVVSLPTFVFIRGWCGDCLRLMGLWSGFIPQMPNAKRSRWRRRRWQQPHERLLLLYVANNKLSHRIASRSSAGNVTHAWCVCYYIAKHVLYVSLLSVEKQHVSKCPHDGCDVRFRYGSCAHHQHIWMPSTRN